ncbi:metal-dependent hydrolase [Pseudoalteromonas 'SMAR']|uniref:metal-dependent hydrolase n=1 Tax=Pseudoalteromonas 'SMAR' TaxID=3416908 RepID=UPI003AF269FE
MDSITQVALGSAVGYAALGSKLGRKALLVGAAFGTLPDLDVLIDFGGAVENFVFHRSFSHSLLIQLMLSPLFAWLLLRFQWSKPVSLMRWSVALFAIMSTHALLDAFTVYGTQLLWPLTDYPFGVSSIFIIDPAYSVPLLCAVIALAFIKSPATGQRLNIAVLTLSCGYLAWSVAAKWYIDDKIKAAMTAQNMTYLAYESTPSAFNTLLWRAVATTPSGHYEIYASIFDNPEEVSIAFYPTENTLLDKLSNERRVRLLQQFTKGLYGIYLENNQLIFSDLRMGVEGFYVFSFVIAKQSQQTLEFADFKQLERRPPLSRASKLFERITDPSIKLNFQSDIQPD